MRIASWNLNSVKARLPRMLDWLHDRRPDVLLAQETKATDDTWPGGEFSELGYQSVHLGNGRWNGVAILSKVGLEEVSYGLDAQPTFEDTAEPRAIGALCGGIRLWSLYVPNGRELGHHHYRYKLDFLAAVGEQATLERARYGSGTGFGLLGDFNVAPHDEDVWDIAAFDGLTHVSPAERAAVEAIRTGSGSGKADELVDLRPRASEQRNDVRPAYTFWEMRMLGFAKGRGMRIDLALVNPALAARVTDVWVDRDARKGAAPKAPSDHAPLVVDLSD